MATLNEYRSKFRLLSKQEVIAERRELFETINGNAFFPLKSWPQEYQRMFWAKPISDKETFKLMMFQEYSTRKISKVIGYRSQ